jgi:hypothetical protein
LAGRGSSKRERPNLGGQRPLRKSRIFRQELSDKNFGRFWEIKTCEIKTCEINIWEIKVWEIKVWEINIWEISP